MMLTPSRLRLMPPSLRHSVRPQSSRPRAAPSSNFSAMAPRRIRLCLEPAAAAAGRRRHVALPPRRRAVQLPVDTSFRRRPLTLPSFHRPSPRSQNARLREIIRRRRRLNPSVVEAARAAVEAVDAATPRRISRRAAVAGRACRGLAGAVLVRSLFVTFVNATCRSSPMQHVSRPLSRQTAFPHCGSQSTPGIQHFR